MIFKSPSINAPVKLLFSSKKDSIYVFEIEKGKNTSRSLTFSDNLQTASRQGTIYTKQHEKLASTFSKAMLYGLTFVANPKKILVLGMGVGIIPSQIATYYPKTTIDIIEINPKIPSIAHQYFQFKKSDNMEIFIEDGYDFVLNSNSSYDVIFVDAFDETYIPVKLLQDNFITKISQMLTQNGIAIFNTFGNSLNYVEEEKKITSKFSFSKQIKSANRIIFASNSELISHKINPKLAKKIDFKKYSLQVKDTNF